MSIYTKLNEARSKFHTLKLEKTGHNTFAKYKYFELGDFLVPALEVFKAVGLCAIVSFDKDIATMTIVDVSTDGGERITITSPMGSASLKGCHEVQNVGAVETYQRRYLWVAALEIVEHDALDAVTGSDPVDEKRKYAAAKPKKNGPMADVRKDLPPLTQQEAEYFDELAAVVHEAFDDSASHALDVIEQEGLDNDQKIHLWDRLESKVRTGLKTEIHNRMKAKEE